MGVEEMSNVLSRRSKGRMWLHSQSTIARAKRPSIGTSTGYSERTIRPTGKDDDIPELKSHALGLVRPN